MSLFTNRREAGQKLAEKIQSLNLEHDVCVLALASGGAPLAAEIAIRFGWPLDLLFVKKVGAPEVGGKTVIVVDDGLATGSTMIAALGLLREQNPARTIVAVPVASEKAAIEIAPWCDQAVILSTPEPFFSVGQWYDDFSHVDDREVEELVKAGDPASRGPVRIPLGAISLEGELIVPARPKGVVIFAHGSGSSRLSPRNRHVAEILNGARFATLLFDLLTPEEAVHRTKVFDIDLLADRLRYAKGWVRRWPGLDRLPIGYFGASTGAAAALIAAAGDPEVRAVVSRGGRPDLAFKDLGDVQANVLLIVGGADHGVIELNERAKKNLPKARFVLVPGAGHLFEEPGAMEDVIRHATAFFKRAFNRRVNAEAFEKFPAPRPPSQAKRS